MADENVNENETETEAPGEEGHRCSHGEPVGAQRRAQSPLAEADCHDRGQVTEWQDRKLEPAEGGQAGAGEKRQLET